MSAASHGTEHVREQSAVIFSKMNGPKIIVAVNKKKESIFGKCKKVSLSIRGIA